jgi:hypothetical protein
MREIHEEENIIGHEKIHEEENIIGHEGDI